MKYYLQKRLQLALSRIRYSSILTIKNFKEIYFSKKIEPYFGLNCFNLNAIHSHETFDSLFKFKCCKNL